MPFTIHGVKFLTFQQSYSKDESFMFSICGHILCFLICTLFSAWHLSHTDSGTCIDVLHYNHIIY